MDRKPPSIEAFFPTAEARWPKSLKQTPLNKIDQISILVKDVDAAVEYFGAVLGWAPFYVVDIFDKGTYKGQFSNYCFKAAFCLVGELEIELLELVSGFTPHVDALQEKGEGLFHLRLETADIDSDMAYLKELGVDSIWDYVIDGDLVNAYTDSHRRFGVRTELVRPVEQLRAIVKKKMV